ncbi:hypothetical protein HHL21_13175 [Massilia sp. RP-1-19]|uniref:Uncharacterized protein n=1 Tax=Massilia polaris TaxID=2728846 RepID=A0A848HQG2_9BURK|nr:hypothetical protein [Massilia polaris]NML62011.1 hypothetical protein [Massilia polaris]
MDAMFKAWHTMRYVRINPMGMDGAGSKRKVNVRRAIDVDLYQLVLQTLERDTFDRAIGRQKNGATVLFWWRCANWACARVSW